MRNKLIELLFEVVAVKPAETINDMADFLIANGVTIATDNNDGCKWIPVSERLPEEREGWGFTYSDVVIVAGKRHDGSLYVSQDTTTDGEWNTTHPLYWMPLPEPPQKGE